MTSKFTKRKLSLKTRIIREQQRNRILVKAVKKANKSLTSKA